MYDRCQCSARCINLPQGIQLYLGMGNSTIGAVPVQPQAQKVHDIVLQALELYAAQTVPGHGGADERA